MRQVRGHVEVFLWAGGNLDHIVKVISTRSFTVKVLFFPFKLI